MNLTNKLLVYMLQSARFAKTANLTFSNGSFIFTPSDNDWKNLINANIIDTNGTLTQKGMKFQPLPDMEVMPSHIIQTIIERAVEEMANRVYKGYIPSDKMYDAIEVLSDSIEMVNEMKAEALEVIETSDDHYPMAGFEHTAEVVGELANTNVEQDLANAPAPANAPANAEVEEFKNSIDLRKK